VTRESSISRRHFLKVSWVAGVGLVIGVYVPGCKGSTTSTPEAAATRELTATSPPQPTSTSPARETATAAQSSAPTASATAEPAPSDRLEPNVFVTIDTQGQVTITIPRTEMGQGVRTALAMILAEELEADWSTIGVVQARADRAFGDQTTGGSTSVNTRYTPLRRAGAVARELLIGAAAQVWSVEPESCHSENGAVLHPASDRRLPYGELVETASTLTVPNANDVPLKDPAEFRIIGDSKKRVDEPRIVNGSALYCSDITLPGMLYAVVARCPVFGGTVAAFDPTSAQRIKGVRHVVELDGAVAVVAENTWAALKGREALDITWNEGENADLNSARIRDSLANMAPQPGQATSGGDATALEAVYHIPYLAHATMEPMTCVADVRSDSCEIWAPTQNPQQAKGRAQSITGLGADAVTVNVPLVGGGFGRRLQSDYVEEAVKISQAIAAPVKVTWTREDDTQHDYYHPLSYNYISGKTAEGGRLVSLPRLRSIEATQGIPTGAWRSVSNFTEAFARECFLDEIALESGVDPVELRRELLPARARAVVELAAEKIGWGSPLPDRVGRGIAYHATFGVTHVAQVAEVSVANDGVVKTDRVVCAVDCGRVINPDMVVAQMEGGIAFGLTAALKADITIENGRAQQSNFHDYPLLRMDEMPVVEVHIVPSDENPTGIGEMGVPPIAPAVANAVFAATGKRVRHIPIRPKDLT
jgi:isoquinoline 1-oxidoreductase beta subunit